MKPEQFLEVAGLLPEAMLLVASDGVVSAVNPSALKLLPLGQQEIKGKQLSSLVTNPQEKVTQYLRSCSKSKSLVPGRLTLLGNKEERIECHVGGGVISPQANGLPALLLLRCKPKETTSSNFISLNLKLEKLRVAHRELAAKNDRLEQYVEERTVALQEQTAALKKSEARIRSIVETAVDGIITTDKRGIVESFNPAAERIFGYSAREIIGKNFKLLMPSPYKQEYVQFMQNHLETTEKSIIGSRREVKGSRKDGSTFPMDLALSEVRLQEQQMFTGIVRDISKPKQAERELEVMHKKLQETSRQAGMSEMATGVLHNVGNVLNSLNISASIVTDKVRSSKVVSLEKATAMIRDNLGRLGTYITEDDKGKLLPRYLIEIAEHLKEEQAATLKELDSLQNNVEHIKEIVSAQQSYARAGGVVEQVSVSELIEDALKINKAALERHGVTVVRDFEQTPRISVEKHKVVQILINIIRNAKHALDEVKRDEKVITLHVEQEADNRIKIEIKDNGIGIPKENLTRIFAHGFTTRKEGHGFGLHIAALTAKEMGGSLTAYSEGHGKGAVVTFKFPLESSQHNGDVVSM